MPKMWRKRNKAGRQVGNWLAKVAGDEVNLGTKDAELATRHLREALGGRRDFHDEIDEAAAALPDTAPAAQSVQLPPPIAAPAAPAAAPPAAPAALPPIPPADPQDFADTGDAAGEAAGAGSAPASPPYPPDPGMSPDVLDVFVRNGAALIVDMQLGLQAAVVRRYTGRKAGPISPDSAARGAAADAWVTQLKIWFPADTMLPPWAIALAIPAMCIPVQVATSTDIPEDEKTPDEAAAA